MTEFALGGYYPPFGNFMASSKAFGQRGGFVNGLNPSLIGSVYYVNANTTASRGPVGSDSNSGLSPLAPFATVDRVFDFLKSGDVIVLQGVIREQVVAPNDIYDVTVLGAANTPRQATSGGVATGGGATWMPPASGAVAATPLIELVAQAWNFFNISFTPHTSSAAVRLTRSASVDTIDASHAGFYGCLFSGQGGTGQIGIEDNGGCGFVNVGGTTPLSGCRFNLLTGTAIKGLNTGAAVPQGWNIVNNVFRRNTNSIGMSLTQGLVANNVINQAANDTNFKINLVAVAGQGSLNFVLNNYFSDAAANVTIAKGYKPGTTDVWRNYVTDTADPIVTVPA
jgi:hypothetical protein